MASIPLLSFFFFFAVATTTAAAKEFQVGGAVGWRIPATNETQLYNVWASRRRFHVGDTLRFRYKNDSVAVVEKWGFYHCNSTTPITFSDTGDTVIHLYTMGTVYFVSGDRERCKQGQNMMVEVMAPVLIYPPAIGTPPENAYSGAMAPSPFQFLSSGGSPESGPGTFLWESLTSFLVSVNVVGVMVGVGLFSF